MFFKFKKPETRGFKYQPRYYNPQEDSLQSKIIAQQNKQEGVTDAALTQRRVTQNFANYKLADRRKPKTWSAANMRLLLILIGFFALFYFLSNKYSNLFMEFLSPVPLQRVVQEQEETWADEELPPLELK